MSDKSPAELLNEEYAKHRAEQIIEDMKEYPGDRTYLKEVISNLLMQFYYQGWSDGLKRMIEHAQNKP